VAGVGELTAGLEGPKITCRWAVPRILRRPAHGAADAEKAKSLPLKKLPSPRGEGSGARDPRALVAMHQLVDGLEDVCLKLFALEHAVPIEPG